MLSRSSRPFIFSALAFLATVAMFAAPSLAKTKKPAKAKRYFIELTSVVFAETVKADRALIEPAVRSKTEAALEANPQILTSRADAPDPTTDPKGFKRWVAREKLAKVTRMNLEIVEATETVEANPRKSGQVLTVSLRVRTFGETIPDREMAFSGEGSATVKQEIGKKLRDADRRYAWQLVAEEAMAAAVTNSVQKLDAHK